ncbi:MAG TPA: peptidoglycan editing factor PgeF [Pseudomonadales bacterium]|nr:peptidoglycan editing factor PgeF [Pseudomonadales bacterium]
MQRHDVGALRYYSFKLFDDYKIVHGIFTRRGGVSAPPWSSLNLGGTVGDDRDNVIENRKRIFEVFDRPVASIYDSWQVHGTEVICTREPRPLDGLHQKADAILSDSPDITLFMRFADCVPIFLYDPTKKVGGVVHAGWRGTVDGVAAEAVKTMKANYGSRPEEILAGIGPSICVDHYEIGKDPSLVSRIKDVFNHHASQVLKNVNGSTHFNLQQANQIVLEAVGVRQVEQAGLCTYGQMDEWYSHRAEHGKTGRFGALLVP